MTTNMLTWREVERQCLSGAMRKWFPSNRSKTEENDRCLYMLASVYDEFTATSWPSTKTMSVAMHIARRRAMRAVAERFVTGKSMNLNYDLKELGSGKVRSEEMRGFWEFRSGPPAEQTRLFGFFARPGCFIATSFRSRGEMPEGNWVDEKTSSDTAWKQTFPGADYMRSPWIVAKKADLTAYLDRNDD